MVFSPCTYDEVFNVFVCVFLFRGYFIHFSFLFYHFSLFLFLQIWFFFFCHWTFFSFFLQWQTFAGLVVKIIYPFQAFFAMHWIAKSDFSGKENETTDTNRQWWIPLIEGENVPPFCWFESLLETFFVIECFWLKTTRMWQKMFLSVKNLFKLWKPLSYSQFSLLSASDILEFVYI